MRNKWFVFFKCKREQRQKTHAGSLFSFQLFVFLFTVQFTACQCNVAHIIPMYSYIINFSKWHLANKAKKKKPNANSRKKAWNWWRKKSNVRNSRHFVWLLSTSCRIYHHEPNIHFHSHYFIRNQEEFIVRWHSWPLRSASNEQVQSQEKRLGQWVKWHTEKSLHRCIIIIIIKRTSS